LGEDVSREWRYNRIIEILAESYPKKITNRRLLEELGNEISVETLYRDVNTLTNEDFLNTFFAMGDEPYFETGLTPKGMNYFEDLSRK